MDLSNIFIFLGGLFGLAVIIIIAQRQFFRKWKVMDAAISYGEGNYIKARNILERIILNEPRNSLAYWYAGRASIQLGQANRGISEIKKAIQINRYDVKNPSIPHLGDFTETGVHLYLRDLYQRTRQENPEFQENQILMQLDPQNAEYPTLLAKTLLKNKEYSERTENYLRIAQSIDQDNAEILSLVALLNLKRNDYKRAENYAEMALAVNPNHIDSKYILGEVLYVDKKYDDAIENLTKGSFSDNFKKSARFTMAKLYFQKEDWINSMEWARKADEASPSIQESETLQWDVLYLMAKIFENMENQKKALEIYTHIYKYQPTYKDVKVILEKAGENKLEYIKDYITAKVEEFQSITEEIINMIGYKIVRIESMDDGNVNLELTKSGGRYIAFVRRTIDLINDELVKRLIKMVQSGGFTGGVFITTGDYTASSRNIALKANIQTLNGQDIEPFIEKIILSGDK